jgi:hypothetical protein
MRLRLSFAAIVFAIMPAAALGQQRASTVPLLPEPTVAALAGELSGASAKRNLEFITRQHRMRASKGFRTAADFVAAQAKLYGLEEVTVHEFPADGHTMYGTQKARLAPRPSRESPASRTHRWSSRKTATAAT